MQVSLSLSWISAGELNFALQHGDVSYTTFVSVSLI